MLRFACLFLSFGLVACSLDLSAVPAPDASRWRPDTARRDAGAPPDAGDGGAVPDAPGSDASTCTWTYTPVRFDPCDGTTPAPTESLTLDAAGTWVYNTDEGTLTAPDGSDTTPTSSDLADARAIWVVDFEVGADATLRLEGSRPLLVAASGGISVAGTIDASSHYGGGDYQRGAGADPAACPASPPEPGETCSNHGGSGGGGGGFGAAGGQGGEGGNGHSCSGDGIPGGLGGEALPAAPSVLRGGCGGRDGGASTEGAGQGPGGPGGGAVHLTARGSLTVSGTVHAGGAGGRGANDDRSGGGGGGSGGMIGLEAADLRIQDTAFVVANGGGGGGGVDHGVAEPGEDGRADGAVAPGGAHEASGTDGGAGGWRDAPNGVSADPAERGGGGGGGGVGFILLHSPGTPRIDTGATLSPAQAPSAL